MRREGGAGVSAVRRRPSCTRSGPGRDARRGRVADRRAAGRDARRRRRGERGVPGRARGLRHRPQGDAGRRTRPISWMRAGRSTRTWRWRSRRVAGSGAAPTGGWRPPAWPGPEPQDGKPVGLVYVAVDGPFGPVVRRLDLDGGRAAIREGAVTAALRLLADQLHGSASPAPLAPSGAAAGRRCRGGVAGAPGCGRRVAAGGTTDVRAEAAVRRGGMSRALAAGTVAGSLRPGRTVLPPVMPGHRRGGGANGPATPRDRRRIASAPAGAAPHPARGVHGRQREPGLPVRDRAWAEGGLQRAAGAICDALGAQLSDCCARSATPWRSPSRWTCWCRADRPGSR